MPLADHDGVRLAYETHEEAGPDAPWVVLVHGLGYARWGWEPVVAPLAARFRLLLLDNRGIGGSDVPPGPYDTATLAGDVVAVMDAAGVDRAHVVGTSLGGMVAQHLALGWPDRVARLVLVCTTPGGEVAYPLPQATLDLIARMPTLPPEVALREAVHNALADATVAGRPEVVERILDHRRRTAQDPDGWAAQAAAGTGHALGVEVAGIAAPTLVVHGDADRVVDVRNTDVLAGLIPDAEVHVLPGAGHLLPWDQPEPLVAVLATFLAAG